MSSEPILRVQGLSKCYRLYADPRQKLWEALSLGRRRLHREFWALQDISFEVGRGESMGIIGRNGSGKSTLLQCIAGTLAPTSGAVEVRGRVAALLELGSGFSPEFTGRENVFLACAVLGLTRRETLERFDAIASFADIGEFMDQPVKTYSSGMAVRLAFAVQTAVEPDLLIVDEALAVGDIFFQQKCLSRMRELRENGVTVLFVSHDMGLVRDFCSWVLLLNEGRLVLEGESHQAVSAYFAQGQAAAPAAPAPPEAPAAAGDSSAGLEERFRPTAIWMRPDDGGEEPACVLGVAVLDQNGLPCTSIPIGGALRFQILLRNMAAHPVDVEVCIKNRYDQLTTCTGSYFLGGEEMVAPPRAGVMIYELELTCMLEAGHYTASASVSLDTGEPNLGRQLDQSPWLGPLQVTWDYESRKAPFVGMFGLAATGRFLK